MPQKKIVSLVTGACGFIGHNMVKTLKKAGHEVIATDTEAAFEKDDLKKGRYPSVVKEFADETIPVDLTDKSSVKKLPKEVDFVFHVASVFSYTAPWELLYRVNVLGTKNLLDLFLGSKRLKKWVQWGAGGVYGMPSKRGNIIFTEDLAPMPENDYLKSKWEQELLIIDAGKKHDLPYIIIRPTTVYGPGGIYGGNQLIIQYGNAGKIVPVPQGLDGYMPTVHVEDVCSAALFLAEKDNLKKEIFNLNDDTLVTTTDYIKFLVRVFNKIPIFLPKINFRKILPLLKTVGKIENFISKKILKKSPSIEPDVVAYFPESFRFSNEKLKKAGYVLKFPYVFDGTVQTIKWLKKMNIIRG